MRSDDSPERSGSASSVDIMVGTPYSAVPPSARIAASVGAGSNLSLGRTTALPWFTAAISPITSPKQWYSGTGKTTLSALVSPSDRPTNRPLLRMLWWVSEAPLGEPVVPDVNWMLHTASGSWWWWPWWPWWPCLCLPFLCSSEKLESSKITLATDLVESNVSLKNVEPWNPREARTTLTPTFSRAYRSSPSR